MNMTSKLFNHKKHTDEDAMKFLEVRTPVLFKIIDTNLTFLKKDAIRLANSYIISDEIEFKKTELKLINLELAKKASQLRHIERLIRVKKKNYE